MEWNREIFANSPALPVESWQHVAFSLSGSTATIYLNGILFAQALHITHELKDVAGENVWLGRSQYPGDYYFNGMIDEVALFNRALNQGELTVVMNHGWNDTPGKVLALHLDEISASNGTTLLDSLEDAYGGILNTDNGTANNSVTGMVGQALSFDGANDYVTLKTKRQGTFI